jgi:hypothetical protein
VEAHALATAGRVTVMPQHSREARTGVVLRLRADVMLSPFATGSRI